MTTSYFNKTDGRTRASRRARTAAIKATNLRRAHIFWSEDNLAFTRHDEDLMSHRHCGRSKCHYCADAYLPQGQIARLNENAAVSVADYISSAY